MKGNLSYNGALQFKHFLMVEGLVTNKRNYDSNNFPAFAGVVTYILFRISAVDNTNGGEDAIVKNLCIKRKKRGKIYFQKTLKSRLKNLFLKNDQNNQTETLTPNKI
jgi:hypothetical protein